LFYLKHQLNLQHIYYTPFLNSTINGIRYLGKRENLWGRGSVCWNGEIKFSLNGNSGIEIPYLKKWNWN